MSCRGCGAERLEIVLDLGRQPLANALRTAEELAAPEPAYPLSLAFCDQCSLAQITDVVPPEEMFPDYLYLSSSSDAFVKHAGEIADRLTVERNLGGGGFVVEIGSNDGYLLQHYVGAGIPVLGIEPATTIAGVANDRGVRTLNTFFTPALAATLRETEPGADVVHANNVLAHVPDVHDTLGGIATILRPDGVLVVETPYVRDLIDGLEFDTIYHEHVFYYSLTSFDFLLRRAGLAAQSVEHLAIHGGSLRILASPVERAEPDGSVTAMLEEERRIGLTTAPYYRSFADRVEELGGTLRSQLEALKADGKRIAAYGAAAKGTVLLNLFGIDGRLVDFVVDRNPLKQGRYLPGVHLPVRDPSSLLTDMPDVVLLLAWNVAEEVVAQQAEYRRRGGRFLVPVPEPRLL